jgi:hypothetical protein
MNVGAAELVPLRVDAFHAANLDWLVTLKGDHVPVPLGLDRPPERDQRLRGNGQQCRVLATEQDHRSSPDLDALDVVDGARDLVALREIGVGLTHGRVSHTVASAIRTVDPSITRPLELRSGVRAAS